MGSVMLFVSMASVHGSVTVVLALMRAMLAWMMVAVWTRGLPVWTTKAARPGRFARMGAAVRVAEVMLTAQVAKFAI